MVGKRFLSLSYIPSPPFPVYFETGPNQIAQADFALSFVACVCIEPAILLAKPPSTLGSQAWCEFLSLILILHLFELVSEYEKWVELHLSHQTAGRAQHKLFLLYKCPLEQLPNELAFIILVRSQPLAEGN